MIPYGRGAAAIVRQLKKEGVTGITVADAQGWIDTFYQTYPGIYNFLEDCKSRVINPRYIVNPWGRYRRAPYTEDRMLIADYQREFTNFPIQCLCGDSHVLTATGYIPISQLPSGASVWDGEQYAPADVVKCGYKQVHEITFSNGATIRCAENHRFILDNNVEIFAKDLHVNTKVPVYRNKAIIDVHKQRLDTDLAWFIGAMIGDGAYSNKWTDAYIAIGVLFPELRDKVNNLFDKLAFPRPKDKLVFYNGKPSHWRLNLRKLMGNQLKALGLTHVTAPNKSIPERYMDYDNLTIANILAGLFDSDGGIVGSAEHGFAVCYTTVSPVMAKQIFRFLGQLGIRTTIKQYANGKFRDFYRVSVFPGDVTLFRDVVPIVAQRKKRLLDVVVACNDLFLDGYKRNVQTCTVTNHTVTTGSEPMYDLTVHSNTHHYIVDGIKVHNSTVGDAMSVALINFYTYKRFINRKVDYRLLLSIHDAVLMEVPIAHVESVVNEVIPYCMVNNVEVPDVGLHYSIGDIDIQLRWGEKADPNELESMGIPKKLCGFKD